MSALTVRAYNVLFGDAILVSVPDRAPGRGRETIRHILIDVGNVLHGDGGRDDVFVPVVRDIRRRLRGRPVDLYVMTHEHLDHVQGLPFASNQVTLDVEFAWLTGSSRPGYYDDHPEARRKLGLLMEAYERIERHLAADSGAASPRMLTMMTNNDRRNTKKCVEYLAAMARRKARYVDCRTRLRRGVHHPFQEARLRVLAPERDTASYYSRLQPIPGVGARDGAAEASRLRRPEPPAGVDPRAFDRLLESWASGVSSNILEIDRAANNTSIVFSLEWRGWRLLFPGDAEQKSWKLMQRAGVLKPCHFLKVSHHGSHNATPPEPILDSIFPQPSSDRRRRVALVSTCGDTYQGVPHEPTLGRLERRCDRILSTADVAPGKSLTVTFSG